jgi:ElaB/YqjD/DUF883 family membrane-anchored ribosome-binding protein
MFQYRSNSFGPSVNAIQNHLGAVEKELEKIGRIAGRRGSAAASVAGAQLGETISAILSDMLDRLRDRGEAASDGAARLGNRALKLGAGYGSDALSRVSAEVEDRPLITLGVALGIGVLIGAAVLGSAAAARK